VNWCVRRYELQFGDTMEDQIVHDRWGQLGFDNLLPEEKDYIMIWWLVAEVFNGTFAQYFGNETGDHAFQALDGLKKCGATEGAPLLQEAMDLFEPYGGYTMDQDVRNDRIEQLEAEPAAQPAGAFREVTNAFQDSKEPMSGLALKRVMEAYRREGVCISKYRKCRG
jgi:hypothetical protein